MKISILGKVLIFAIVVLFSANIFAQDTKTTSGTFKFTEEMMNSIIQYVEDQRKDSPYADDIEIDFKCILTEIFEQANAGQLDLHTASNSLEDLEKNIVTIYPNPSKGTDVTLEFLKEWDFKCKKPVIKSLKQAGLQLFYKDKLITKLDDFPIINNKVVIPARLIKEPGTYTITPTEGGQSMSFMVTK